MTDAERAKDEQVLAAIIAGAESSGRKMQPHGDERESRFDETAGSGNFFGIQDGDHQRGPACAVGMGLLFAGVTLCDWHAPLDEFARHHDVSLSYACGVTDGFEADSEHYIDCNELEGRNFADYERGYAVGVSAFYSTTIAKEQP